MFIRNERRYITGLDGLRAIAVIAVILYHLNTTVFKGGFLGVPIFMVISGYLITDHLLEEYELTGHFNYFYFWKKRIKRLYPTLVTMLLGTSAYIFLFERQLLFNLWKIVLSNLLYVYNWWQIDHGESYFQQFAGNESPFTHLWTLSIEGQFYFFWPLIVLLLLKRFSKRKVVFYFALLLAIISSLLMAVLYVPNTDPSRIYYGTDTRMFAILFGAALATVWPSRKMSHQVAKNAKLFLDLVGLAAFIGILSFLLKADGQSSFVYYGGMTLFSLLVTIMVAVIVQPVSFWDHLLTNPIFSWVGSRSYAIYVYQFPVMIFFESKFEDIANHPVMYPIIEVVIILLISEFSYRFFEKKTTKFNYTNLFKQRQYIDFNQPLSRKNKKLGKQKRILLPITILLIFLGSAGIVNSAVVKTNPANHSALATKLAKNKDEQSKEASKQKIIAKKAIAASNNKENQAAASSSEAAPKSNLPVDEQFEAYNLSRSELQKAQTTPLTAIGDSVMLACQPDLLKVFPKMYINAAVSRQATAAIPLLQNLAQQHLLASNVLIGLGTNGPIQPNTMQQIMATIGSNRQVYWVNVHVPTRSWQDQVNNFLATATKEYHNLKIINWYEHSNNQNQWFYSDQTHPNNVGEMYYASYIAKQIVS